MVPSHSVPLGVYLYRFLAPLSPANLSMRRAVWMWMCTATCVCHSVPLSLALGVFFLHCGVYESRSAVWPQGEVPRLLGGRNRERRAEKGSCMGRGAGVPRYPLPTPLGRFCPRTRTLAGFCPRTRARRPRRQRMRRAAPSGFRCGVPASDPSVLAYSYRVR